MSKNNSPQNIKNELEFRLLFREEFGVDYLEALNKIKNARAETNRKWNQVAIKAMTPSKQLNKE